MERSTIVLGDSTFPCDSAAHAFFRGVTLYVCASWASEEVMRLGNRSPLSQDSDVLTGSSYAALTFGFPERRTHVMIGHGFAKPPSTWEPDESPRLYGMPPDVSFDFDPVWIGLFALDRLDLT